MIQDLYILSKEEICVLTDEEDYRLSRPTKIKLICKKLVMGDLISFEDMQKKDGYNNGMLT